jgi:hypothetical protein
MVTTLGSHSSRFPTLIALAGLGVVAAITAGCGSDGASPLIQVDRTQEKPANSVYREASPGTRSQSLTAQFNTYRQQAFGSAAFNVAHDDVAYTAAFRHAVYLNTVNSADYVNGSSVPTPGDSDEINADLSLDSLVEEAIAPVTGLPYPALYTSDSLWARLEAPVGGRSLVDSIGADATSIAEFYSFNGDIPRLDGTVSTFRGYPAAQGTAVDNLWYSRLGRASAMRAAVRFFGYGQKDDTSSPYGKFTPPYPLFNGKFMGVTTVIAAKPAVAAQSTWPNNGNTNVNPYGLDTDLTGSTQFSGPPLHFTLPVDEPILRTGGVVAFSLAKIDGFGGAPIAITAGSGTTIRTYSNTSGLVVPDGVGVGRFVVEGAIAPAASYTISNWSQGPNDEDGFVDITLTSGTTAFTVGDEVDIVISKTKTSTAFPGEEPDVGRYGRFAVTAVTATTITVNVGTVETQAPGFLFIDDYIWKIRKDDETSKATRQFVEYENVRIDQYIAGAVNKIAFIDDTLKLKNGEFIAVPTSPLERLTWYRFQYQARTPTYDSGLVTVDFRTNNNWP